MILDPKTISPMESYRFMISSVLPRPIAWVSSMDEKGILNLAPFSYFTGVCVLPMTLVFCPVVPSRKGTKKDTVRNIEATGEFVINMTNMETREAMNLTATDLAPEKSEFEWAGVTPVASERVRVPRVAEAPIAYECTLQRIVTVSDEPGGGYAVFGEVQCIHVADDLYRDGVVNLNAYQPIGRLGADDYVHVTETFEMKRVPPPAD